MSPNGKTVIRGYGTFHWLKHVSCGQKHLLWVDTPHFLIQRNFYHHRKHKQPLTPWTQRGWGGLGDSYQFSGKLAFIRLSGLKMVQPSHEAAYFYREGKSCICLCTWGIFTNFIKSIFTVYEVRFQYEKAANSKII